MPISTELAAARRRELQLQRWACGLVENRRPRVSAVTNQRAAPNSSQSSAELTRESIRWRNLNFASWIPGIRRDKRLSSRVQPESLTHETANNNAKTASVLGDVGFDHNSTSDAPPGNNVGNISDARDSSAKWASTLQLSPLRLPETGFRVVVQKSEGHGYFETSLTSDSSSAQTINTESEHSEDSQRVSTEGTSEHRISADCGTYIREKRHNEPPLLLTTDVGASDCGNQARPEPQTPYDFTPPSR
jgi:hypothetical protein